MSKQPMSKKAKQAREKQIIEDSTFGLKNKNKSKKVQQFVTRVEKAAKQSTGSYDKVNDFFYFFSFSIPTFTLFRKSKEKLKKKQN